MSVERNLLKVFVYGTLKKSLPNHHWLQDTNSGYARFHCDGKTQTKFPLIVATKYNIPFLLNVSGAGNHVKGEIYLVCESMLKHLDVLEEYPEFYDREIHKINGSDGEIHDCWVYMIKKFPIQYLSNYTLLEEYNNTKEQPYCEEYGSDVIDLDIKIKE